MRLHKIKPPCTVAIAGKCTAAQLNLFEELTGAFVCDFPKSGLKGMFYYKYREYMLTCLPCGSSACSAENYDCVIYVLNPYRLESQLVNALRFSRSAKRFIVLICRGRKEKIKPPLNIKLLSGVLGAHIVFETCSSSKGVNRLLDTLAKLFK